MNFGNRSSTLVRQVDRVSVWMCAGVFAVVESEKDQFDRQMRCRPPGRRARGAGEEQAGASPSTQAATTSKRASRRDFGGAGGSEGAGGSGGAEEIGGKGRPVAATQTR